MAIIIVVTQFGSLGRKLAVAMNSEYVYSGLQGAAFRWQQNGWVSSAGPVSNVDLWIRLLSLVELSSSIFHWVKIPSHAGLRGNDVADELANKGRSQSSLYHSRQSNAQVGLAIHPPPPPRLPSYKRSVTEEAHPGTPLQGPSPRATPFDTPGRNLFSAQRAGPLCDEMDDGNWPERGPVALNCSDTEPLSSASFSSVESVLVSSSVDQSSTLARSDSHNHSY